MTATTEHDAAQLARDAGANPVDYLRARGYVYAITDEAGLRRAFEEGTVTAYVGFDPTAPSLHVGHLLSIMMLASLQRFGHRPIALGGGGTALVGDPSGKTSTRAVLSEETIQANLRAILPQFNRFLDFEGGRFGDNPPALLMNNAEWLLPTSSFSVTLAATSRSMRCSRPRHTASGWSPASDSTSSSSTTGSSRRTISFTSTESSAVASKWAAPTSGGTSSPAST